jgi:hypothetical protein
MRSVTLAAVAAALLVVGCGPEVVGPRNSEIARLRLASASPDAGTLDLVVNGKTVAQAVGSTASAPAVMEPGPATGEVRSSGSATVLAAVPLALAAGKSYTVLVAGPREALTAMVSVDTGSGLPPVPPPGPPGQPVDSGTAPPPLTDAVRFRIVHAAPHAPPLDPYLLPAGAPLDTLPTLQPFAYGSLALTADLIRAPGHYVVKFTEAGTTHVALQSDDIDAAAGELLTLVLGENADQSLRVDVVQGSP